MIIQDVAYARSGLVGNPSDIFNGKVISFLFDAFSARLVLYETPRLVIRQSRRDCTDFEDVDDLMRYRRQFGYYGGIRLIEATIIRFYDYCQEAGIRLPARNFTIEYDSTIPFGIGLGGSSAITKATLTALIAFFEIPESSIPLAVQPQIILEAETRELDISAGPQDRVIVVYGGLLYMDFSKEAFDRNKGLHGDYTPLDPRLLPPMYIAYNERLSKSSGAVHNTMRYRANVEREAKVLDVMKQKAEIARQTMESLCAGKPGDLKGLMDRDFDLRRSVYTISPGNLEMVEIARAHGSSANNSGSGGAVAGTYEDKAHLRRLTAAFQEKGYSLVPVKVVTYS